MGFECSFDEGRDRCCKVWGIGGILADGLVMDEDAKILGWKGGFIQVKGRVEEGFDGLYIGRNAPLVLADLGKVLLNGYGMG